MIGVGAGVQVASLVQETTVRAETEILDGTDGIEVVFGVPRAVTHVPVAGGVKPLTTKC